MKYIESKPNGDGTFDHTEVRAAWTSGYKYEIYSDNFDCWDILFVEPIFSPFRKYRAFSEIEESPSDGEVLRALIRYLLSNTTEEPMNFLHCWNEGDYDGCREWDDVPDILFPKLGYQYMDTK